MTDIFTLDLNFQGIPKTILLLQHDLGECGSGERPLHQQK